MAGLSNKEVVLKFNKEFIQDNNSEILKEIVAPDFTNHTAAEGVAKDVSGLVNFIGMIHKGFSDVVVEIFEQIGEDDLVATLKIIHATHTGDIMGHAPTGKKVMMNIIDMVRLRDGQYVDHWGRNDVMQVIQSL